MNTKMRILLLTLLSVGLFGVGAFGQQPVIEREGARAPDRKEAAVSRPPLPKSLDVAAAVREGRGLFDLDAVTAAENAAADEELAKMRSSGSPGPQRVGLVRPVGQLFGFASFVSPASPALSGEEKLWLIALRSPGAAALRLRFVNFDVGGATVTVYTRDGDVVITRGPFSGKGPEQDGDFWTASLPGDTVFIEVSGSDEPRLEIAETMHLDQDPTATAQKQRRLSQNRNQGKPVKVTAELGCHLDVACETVDRFARDATALLTFQVGTGAFSCTGTILNDFDDETAVPYLLTANHCGIEAANVNTLQATFLFQRNSCGGALSATMPSLTGGVVLEANGGNDMRFIRLNGSVPAGAAMAGWSTGGPPNGSFGIHHPGGSFKRATFFDSHSFYWLCPFSIDPNYWVVLAQRGAIEPGSSGSGLFDPSGRLVGQLRGRCGPGAGANGNCSTDGDWRAVYGKFSVTHGIIRRWLEIGGTIHVDRNFTGPELGTPSQPFRTVTAAYNLAWDGARIKIKTGSYPETLALSKRVTILADGGVVTIGH